MDKLQQVIATIINSPMEEKEKLLWIGKFTAITDPSEFSNMLEEMAKYFDSFAEKYEDEVRLYDKYLGILEKFQIELAQAQEKQIKLPSSVDSSKPSTPPPSMYVDPKFTGAVIDTAKTQTVNQNPVLTSPIQPSQIPTANPSVSPPPVTPVPPAVVDEPAAFVDELEKVQKTIEQLKNQAINPHPPMATV